MTRLRRVFKHGSLELPDLPRLTPGEVQEHYAASYPELTNASIKGPDYDGSKEVYTFQQNLGTKG